MGTQSLSLAGTIKDRWFQFPSNGKVEPKAIGVYSWGETPEEVSIPFKRESGAKVGRSNITGGVSEVSIPFKRESGAKESFMGARRQFCIL